MRAKRDLKIIYDEAGAIGNWKKPWEKKPIEVNKCPFCNVPARFYILNTKKGVRFVLQHGSKRHGFTRLFKKWQLDPKSFSEIFKMDARAEFLAAKLAKYVRERMLGVPAVGSNVYKPKSSYSSKRIIIDDFEPPRELEHRDRKALHLEALFRLKKILEFHHWTVKEDRGVLYAMPPNFMDYAFKFYVKVGSKPIVHLNYDFEKSALAVLKLRKRRKNGRVWFEGRWLYTPLYQLEAMKGSSVRLSKLPLYPLYELLENIKAMGGGYELGV
jgi:hypothetical protein